MDEAHVPKPVQVGSFRTVVEAGAETLEHEAPVTIGQGFDVGPGRFFPRHLSQRGCADAVRLQCGADRFARSVTAHRTEIVHLPPEQRQLHRHIHGVAAHQAVANRRQKAVDAVVAHSGEGLDGHVLSPCWGKPAPKPGRAQV